MTKDNSYSIAIIIPNWNGKKYLPSMLDSILAQSFEDFRVFVIDDQSTDGSTDVISSYASKDPRIHFMVRDREPKGAQTCRNIGFEQSEGAKYVVFFDNDDLIAPFCLRQRYDFMEAHPELDFGIFPAINFKDHPYDEIGLAWGCRYIDDTLKSMLDWTLPMVGWTNIYRRSSYVDYNLSWDEKLKSMQDSDFNIQAILKGCKFDYADHARPDYFYRDTQSSISSKLYSAEQADSHVHLVKKIFDSLSSSQLHRYEDDLRSYFVKFLEILISHKKQLSKLLDIDWLHSHPCFNLSLKLWSLFSFKGKLFYGLFSKEIKYFNSNQSSWRNFARSKAEFFYNQKVK